ncbi:MAG: hypothetical protein M1835_005024 [Candelina submexicana]|nr:MAG: hypothetical protein M1835_005024 [Candelina submexicana]
MLRQRNATASSSTSHMDDPQEPLLHSGTPAHHNDEAPTSPNYTTVSRRTQWLAFAVASGACAAFNGVFAKLTTTELTSTWAGAIAGVLGLGRDNRVVEVGIRAMFFGLNLVFNGIMWALFTTALARGTSTTQVAIINTSSNFMITAIMGWLIFAEALPPLWWLGAALLVAGSVIIGRRDEEEKARLAVGVDRGGGLSRETSRDEEEETLLGDTEDVEEIEGESKPKAALAQDAGR